VRYTEDGTLVFAGRSDTQVKLRGFRIELGEIEAAVASHAQVRDTAVVVQRLGGAARLVCFMVFAEGATNDVSAIEASLRQRLPAYMVPSAIVALTALPLTSNGKIDRKALETMPVPAVTDADPRKPNTPTEEEVAAVWREVLRMDMPMPATANLFRLGGDSLSAINIVSRVNKAFGMRLSLRDFLVEPTIERLAGAIEEQRCVAAMAASAPAAGEPAAARDEFTL
jgi:acyl carrier protein